MSIQYIPLNDEIKQIVYDNLPDFLAGKKLPKSQIDCYITAMAFVANFENPVGNDLIDFVAKVIYQTSKKTKVQKQLPS